jgi:hypothetical protein
VFELARSIIAREWGGENARLPGDMAEPDVAGDIVDRRGRRHSDYRAVGLEGLKHDLGDC